MKNAIDAYVYAQEAYEAKRANFCAAIARWIAKEKKEHGLSDSVIAKSIGKSRMYLWQLCHMKRVPSIKTVEELQQYFDAVVQRKTTNSIVK